MESSDFWLLLFISDRLLDFTLYQTTGYFFYLNGSKTRVSHPSTCQSVNAACEETNPSSTLLLGCTSTCNRQKKRHFLETTWKQLGFVFTRSGQLCFLTSHCVLIYLWFDFLIFTVGLWGFLISVETLGGETLSLSVSLWGNPEVSKEIKRVRLNFEGNAYRRWRAGYLKVKRFKRIKRLRIEIV